MGTAYLTSYGTRILGFDHPFVLWTGLVDAVVFGIAIALSATYSDRVGRRRVITTSCAAAIPRSLVPFPLLDTGNPVAYIVAMCVMLTIFGIAYGPTGALLPELFQTRFRYTGAGLANLAGVLGGAIPPLLAAPLAAQFGRIAIGVMLALLSVLSLACAKALSEIKEASMT